MIDYVYLSRFWFAVASLFAIVLFTITFKRAMIDGHNEVRHRPALWIWLATSSIAGPAFIAVSGPTAPADIGVSLFFQSTWMISLFFFSVNVVGILNGFFTYVQDMSIWTMAFASAAFAIHTVMYHSYLLDTFTYVVSIFSIAIATAITATCALWTAHWVLDLSLFLPRQKWGPVNFMKLTHEAFRFAIPNLKGVVAAMDVSKVSTVRFALQELKPFIATFHAHSVHEDEVLFPVARSFYPGLNPKMDADHENIHALLDRLSHVIKEFPAGAPGDEESAASIPPALAAVLNEVKAAFPAWADEALEHLRDEEQSVTVVIRKQLSIARQREVTRQVFEVTPSREWHSVLPWTLKNLPVPMWKVRYLRTFLWAVPDRAQEIGLIVYRGVDSALWSFLVEEIPELIPRGLSGWRKLY